MGRNQRTVVISLWQSFAHSAFGFALHLFFQKKKFLSYYLLHSNEQHELKGHLPFFSGVHSYRGIFMHIAFIS
jgi:hypothetical protein